MSHAVTADGVQVTSALRLATLVAASPALCQPSLCTHSSAVSCFSQIRWSLVLQREYHVFCESVVRSCFTCGTCWLLLLCAIVKAFSAAAANQKPYLNKELCIRKSVKTNCWQCVTFKPSRRLIENVCWTYALSLQSQENITSTCDKGTHIHHKSGWFQPEWTNFSSQRKRAAREYELDCTRVAVRVTAATEKLKALLRLFA